jgi:hypothetical protein
MLHIAEKGVTKARDLQIQVDLDAILGKHKKEVGSTAVQYPAKELSQFDENDIAKASHQFTLWLVAKMIEKPHPFFQVQVQWGITENQDFKLIIGEKGKSFGWNYFNVDFSKEIDHTKVTKAMIAQSHWLIKDFRRYGYLK